MFSRRWITCLLLMTALLAGAPAPARAAWVWSPQTGWIGPSGAPKDTPEAQLDYAVSFFEQKDYDKARLEFKKVLRFFRESHEAADAQYYLGRCLEAERDYYKAFLEYRKAIQVYPSTARFNEILERMAQIGNHFLAGNKRKLLGGAAVLPARDKAVEVFQAIVEDGPFSAQGELAQYKLGLAHLALGEYEQAVTAFEQVIERYPNSPLVDDARFQIAQASLKGTFKPGYDQHATDRAIEELHSFVGEYPSSDLSPEAVNKLQTLRERRAQHEFQVAQYYERRKQLASAMLYYQTIVEDYSETSWAPKATERLAVLEPLAQ